MLFNSYEFIFGYLPITMIGFFLLASQSRRLAALWLAAASLFFYGWWNPAFVALVMASVTVNYAFGYAIGHVRIGSNQHAKLLLAAAVTANLAALAYFKYANFFVATISGMLGVRWAALDIILPLGISFFTFTQIAFLVDVFRGEAKEYSFIHYVLFVTYFPHLIAGPVLHHKQMMPQFGHAPTYKLDAGNISIGVTIFAIGLAKKVLLADQFALYANPVFDGASMGGKPALLEAWIGALAYTLQLYFDFSGYSDMAIGLSRMFNVKLPLNFDSPYKAANIIEFWRRWHMTLSTFLRDYLYLPLGGNRKGPMRRYANLMTTMLLGGLWHGAGWNYVLWGALHGLYLIVNHGWRRLVGSRGNTAGWSRIAGGALTFAAVVVAWVPFRASDWDTTVRLWEGMAGLNGVSLPTGIESIVPEWIRAHASFDGLAPLATLSAEEVLAAVPFGLFVVWALPNTQEWMSRFRPAWNDVPVSSRWTWSPALGYALATGAMLGFSLLSLSRATEFLYFQF